jgi:hypothetical protein
MLPIPIPIGTRHVAAVQGAVWKLVSCTHCKQSYAYLVDVEATGESHDPLFLDGKGAAARARAQAELNLVRKCHKVVVPVPCPSCGSYQDDMARMLKDDVSINPLQIAGAVIAVLSLVPLVFDIPYLWVLAVVMAVAGLTLLACGYVHAFRFDPNAGNPEPRKALGRQHAVWGEQLAQLLEANPPAEDSGSYGTSQEFRENR